MIQQPTSRLKVEKLILLLIVVTFSKCILLMILSWQAIPTPDTTRIKLNERDNYNY